MDNTSRQLKYFVLAALFAAVTVVCAWITVPLPFTPVPINLATLAVFLAGGLLGPKYGLLAECVYVLCGGFGLPVFAGFKGGPAVLAGPTGGFIAGYLVCAFVVGVLVNRIYSADGRQRAASLKAADGNQKTAPARRIGALRHSSGQRIVYVVLSLAAGLFCCYALGMIWFMILTGSGLIEGLVACVIPFLVGDGLKIALAAFLIDRLRRTGITARF